MGGNQGNGESSGGAHEPLHQICREQLSTPHNVVLFCGAGVTMSAHGADGSWVALLRDGLQYAQDQGRDSTRIQALRTRLDSSQGGDPGQLLELGDALTHLFSTDPGLMDLWLRDRVEHRFVNSSGALLQALAECAALPRVRLATTNYDFLLQRARGWKAGSTPAAFSWRDEAEATDWQRGGNQRVYHVHGHALDAESIVLGTRSYETLNQDGWVQRLRTCMAVGDTVFFIGCGATLQDPAFRAIFDGDFKQVQAANRSRLWFQLVGEGERVGHRLLTPLTYGAGHADLPGFLLNSLLPWLRADAMAAPPASIGTYAVAPQPVPASLPDDAQRIASTRAALLRCLPQELFQGIAGLQFAQDGLPAGLSQQFQPADPPVSRRAVADGCILQILQFGIALMKSLASAGTSVSALGPTRKSAIRHALINAMQQAILLSANLAHLPDRRILAAFDPAQPCELPMVSWLSVSVALREQLSDHLNAEFPAGQRAVLQDQNLLPISGGVELGTGDGAKRQVQKALWKKLKLSEGDLPDNPSPNQLSELRGEASLRKDLKQHLITIIEPGHSQFTPEFIRWLNQDLHLGVVTITATDGAFELEEGHWKARLIRLIETLRPLEPAPEA